MTDERIVTDENGDVWPAAGYAWCGPCRGLVDNDACPHCDGGLVEIDPA